MKKNLNSTIKTAYFYLFSAVGIILLITGVFKLTDYTVNKVFFDTYYLPNEATRCSVPAPALEDSESNRNEEYQKNCEQQLEQERRFTEITDASSAVTFIVVGTALFVFHYRRARKLT